MEALGRLGPAASQAVVEKPRPGSGDEVEPKVGRGILKSHMSPMETSRTLKEALINKDFCLLARRERFLSTGIY
jgi:hypothetical protein